VGLGLWVQARMARQLGVSAATLSRDMAAIFPLMTDCPTCGQLRPPSWFEED